MQLTKAHATANDFLLYADLAGVSEPLADAEVRRLCDRRLGIGADGLIRIAPAREGDFFMDYRNADGSYAEMCGNGIRAMAAYLRERGLHEFSAPARIETRGGIVTVNAVAGGFRVAMGRAILPAREIAERDGFDVAVTIAGIAGQRPGLSVALPNPHVVVALPDAANLAALPWLAEADVQIDPAPRAGTNVELVVPGGETSDGHGVIDMRVIERGVGETRSCGTGACAAAFAVRHWAGAGAPAIWQVRVPGGTLIVEIDGEDVYLTGPAELVADVTLLS